MTAVKLFNSFLTSKQKHRALDKFCYAMIHIKIILTANCQNKVKLHQAGYQLLCNNKNSMKQNKRDVRQCDSHLTSNLLTHFKYLGKQNQTEYHF